MRVAIALAVAEVLHQLASAHCAGAAAPAASRPPDERARRAVRRRTPRCSSARTRDRARTRRARARLPASPAARTSATASSATAQRARIGEADVLARHADHAPRRRRADRRRRRASGTSSTATRRDRSRAPTCAARRSGRRTLRRPCRSGAGCARSSSSTNARSTTARLRFCRRPCASCSTRLIEPPAVAVGVADRAHRAAPASTVTPGIAAVDRAVEQLRRGLGRQRLQHIDRRARQQRAVDLERRVLGRRADERQQAALDERQERVLLRLVEAMHFVDEQDRCAAGLLARELGARDGVADVLDAGEHGRDRDEVGVERIGHQPRERRLAHARRAPQDHRMRLARRERDGERLARRQQMALADHLVDRLRAQPLGERRQRSRIRAAAKRSVIGKSLSLAGAVAYADGFNVRRWLALCRQPRARSFPRWKCESDGRCT